MAIRGRKPKPAGQARHRGRPVYDWTEVPDVPFEGGWELPERRANGRPWPDRTKAKWAAWSSMPHCVSWQPSEWHFALTAIELAAWVHDGETRWAGELRNWEKVLGTTYESRRDQRIRYVEPLAERDASAEVTDIARYREL